MVKIKGGGDCVRDDLGAIFGKKPLQFEIAFSGSEMLELQWLFTCFLQRHCVTKPWKVRKK